MTTHRKQFFTIMVLLLISLFSCRKDDFDSLNIPQPGNSSSVTASLAGIVRNADGSICTGCTIEVNGQTTVTDSRGIYTFFNVSVSSKRAVVTCTKAGKNKLYKSFIPSTHINYVNFYYADEEKFSGNASSIPKTFTTQSGATITIPANALVDENGVAFNGNYDLTATYLNPDASLFGLQVPGSDLLTNDDRILYSYGMIDVVLTSGTKKLQLLNTATAVLTFPIAASQLSTAPSTMPAWHFDEATALWDEEGSVAKVGNYYTMDVHHFSWWNVDYPFPKAYVDGKIHDCNGNGFANITFTFNGGYNSTTNANGEFHVWVPAGMPLTYQIKASMNNYIISSSNVFSIPSLGPGQTYIAPTYTSTNCLSQITGVVTGCKGDVNGYVMYMMNGAPVFVSFSGQYSIMVPASTTVALHFVSGNLASSTTIVTMPVNQQLILPVDLCNTAPLPPVDDNTILVDGGPWDNLLITIDTSFFVKAGLMASNNPPCFVEINNMTWSEHLDCNLNLTLPGTTGPTNQVGIVNNFLDYSNSQYDITFNTGTCSGIFELIQIDNVGGRVIIEYNGDAIAYYNGNATVPYPVYVRARFNVMRTD